MQQHSGSLNSSTLSLAVVLSVVLTGCNEDGGSVSGKLLLEGQPIPGEVLLEPLDKEDQTTGQSETAYADTTGEFEAELSDIGEATHIRIVIRATPVSEEGVPSSFDSTQLPEKVVTLKRKLPLKSPLVFALTR
mgnify:CR=1 FL=1